MFTLSLEVLLAVLLAVSCFSLGHQLFIKTSQRGESVCKISI